MSNKKRKSKAEEIQELFKPKELLDPEDDPDLLRNFGTIEDEEGFEVEQPKKRGKFARYAPDLSGVHEKYKGVVVSRAQLEREMNGESSSEEETSEEGLSEDEGSQGEDKESQEEDEESQKGSQEEAEDSQTAEESDADDSENEEDSITEDDENSDDEKFNLVSAEDTSNLVEKGKHVKNQLKIWERLLEMRIKTQKLVQIGNSFPSGDTYSDLTKNSEFKSATANTATTLIDLIKNLQTLKSNLLENYPETRPIKRKCEFPSNSRKVSAIEEELSDKTFVNYRNSVLRKWHDKIKVGTKAKNMETQDIIQKIENSMINKNELVTKTKTFRGGFSIVGSSVENGDVVPEIYEDSDFYHNLLRELIEYKTNLSDDLNLGQKIKELQSLRNKMKKKVDTRASKGRKIRYVVHNKMINFMAPVDKSDWTDEARTELYNSLFGKVCS